MKRKFDHSAPASPSNGALTGPKYWRSLDELADTPGFREHLAREFPEGASSLNGVDRREFMRLMAASFALGGLGLAGCRRPEAHILPYGKSVEYTVPGLPLYFATAMPLRKSALPLLAETHSGRPTKLEGNPSYLPHGGASSLLAQASVLDLYDPERATAHTKQGDTLSTAQVNDLLARLNQTYTGSGEGLAFLADESASPTRARLVAKLKANFPKAIWAEYEPVQDEPPLAAAQAAFGRNVKPVYRFAKARRILSLDADFFHAESGALYYAREFAQGRRVSKPDDEMNRLYVAESGFSLTGSMADHRLRLASSHMLALAAAISDKISGRPEFAALALGLTVQEGWIEACAQDLLDHKSECLVVAGAHLPWEVHAIVHALNAQLGNLGHTVDLVEQEAPGASTIQGLATAVKAGAVKTLLVLNGNPVYNAPADLDFAALLKAVPDVIRYGYYRDETSALAGTHLAATHYLESWGDARTVDGTVVPVQPMIMPLFNGLMEVELLARLTGEEQTGAYEQVFTTIGKLTGGAAKKTFEKFLHDGLLEGSAYPVVTAPQKIPALKSTLVQSVLATASKPGPLSQDNLEVRFTTDHKMDDGRFANNGWLQECPDPMTKISWDNAILVSPRLAQELNIVPAGSLLQVARKETAEFYQGRENARVFEVTLNGRTITGPVHIQPGLSNYTIVLPLGYGRTQSGHIGTGAGFSAYPLRTSAGMAFATGATLRDTGERRQLANTQEHWSMEGRDIVREANYESDPHSEEKNGFKDNPRFVAGIGMESHTPPVLGKDAGKDPAFIASTTPRGNSLYETPNLDGIHQWGMSIDLNTCIGCNACVVACQAENNIPIVGREQVMRGREMHWIRLDRYYSDGKADAEAFGAEGNKTLPEDPQVSMQPMTCQHCELAPCETVCPVNATVHDDEGLNVMAYNRCIGTRYCANNCPYKVRRFNFFDYNKRATDALYLGVLGHQSDMPELVKMVKNPDVTVRMRGVMEKCTYCVQRIQSAKIAQKRTAGPTGNVEIPDGTIKTACQQVCPVEAIVFGNIKDEHSAVSIAKKQERDYAVLGYLNVRPRTTYLGKLRNPNPAMPDYAALPLSRIEYNNKNHPAHDAGHGSEKPAAKQGGHE